MHTANYIVSPCNNYTIGKPVSVPQTPDPIYYDEITQTSSDNKRMELSQLDPEMSVNAAYAPLRSRNLRTQ